MNSKLFYKKRNVGPSRELKDQAAMATKGSKARALPKFWVTVNPISTKGADYATVLYALYAEYDRSCIFDIRPKPKFSF